MRIGPSGLSARTRLDPVLARDRVLGLELVAAARREAETEVRQPLGRRAGHAKLLGGVRRVGAGDRVARTVRGGRAETRVERLRGLHPDLVNPSIGPAREKAGAVAESEQLIEIRLDGSPRQPLEHLLPELELRRLGSFAMKQASVLPASGHGTLRYSCHVG